VKRLQMRKIYLANTRSYQASSYQSFTVFVHTNTARLARLVRDSPTPVNMCTADERQVQIVCSFHQDRRLRGFARGGRRYFVTQLRNVDWARSRTGNAARRTRGAAMKRSPLRMVLPLTVIIALVLKANTRDARSIECKIERIGGDPTNGRYGAWPTCVNLITKYKPNIWSFGVGCDTTFELDLKDRVSWCTNHQL